MKARGALRCGTTTNPYIIHKGLRLVKPYVCHVLTYAKGRWFGRSLLEVCSQEFKDRNSHYYRVAIQRGLIRVNGATVDPDYRLKNSDHIVHTKYRQEYPVSAEPIRVLGETDDLLAVHKPPTIPVHPCGGYNDNTLINILAREHGMTGLALVHRLDIITSGVVVFAKNKKSASEFGKRMMSRELSKTYLAKVTGKFPMSSDSVEMEEMETRLVRKFSNGDASRWTSWKWVSKSQLQFSCPLHCNFKRKRKHHCHPDGKESITSFRRLYFDGTYSVLECTPKTGRTHQIRLHLQALGFPIANDAYYGGDKSLPYNHPHHLTHHPHSTHSHTTHHPHTTHSHSTDYHHTQDHDRHTHNQSKSLTASADQSKSSSSVNQSEHASTPAAPATASVDQSKSSATANIKSESSNQPTNQLKSVNDSANQSKYSTSTADQSKSSTSNVDQSKPLTIDQKSLMLSYAAIARMEEDMEALERSCREVCPECNSKTPGGDAEGLEALHHSLPSPGIWLHAFRYTGPNFDFKTHLPVWAMYPGLKL